ncbi:unnamed protein product, partial [Porites lobata]
FAGIEGFVTAIVNLFPLQLRRGYRKEIFIACVCMVWYLIGSSMVTKGGVYVFQLFDSYSASGSALSGWRYSKASLLVGCTAVFIFSLVTYSPLKYDDYDYPDWGQAIGWIMALSSIACIPFVMLYKLVTTPGSFKERWSSLITPIFKHQSPGAQQMDSLETYKSYDKNGL